MDEIVNQEPFLLIYFENGKLIKKIFTNLRKVNLVANISCNQAYLESYIDKKKILLDLDNILIVKTFDAEYNLSEVRKHD